MWDTYNCTNERKTTAKEAGTIILDYCNILNIISNFIPHSYDGFYLPFFPSSMYPLNNVLPPYFSNLRVTNHEDLTSFSHIALEWPVHSHIHYLKSGSITFYNEIHLWPTFFHCIATSSHLMSWKFIHEWIDCVSPLYCNCLPQLSNPLLEYSLVYPSFLLAETIYGVWHPIECPHNPPSHLSVT